MKTYLCPGCSVRLSGIGYCERCGPRVRDIQKQVKKIMAQAKLSVADGKVCADCGKRAFHWDHRLYSQPLNVVPVCRQCNFKRGPALDIRHVLEFGINYTVPEPKIEAPYIVPEDIDVIDLEQEIDDFESGKLLEYLTLCDWNRTKTAKHLSISFRALRYRMARLKLTTPNI